MFLTRGCVVCGGAGAAVCAHCAQGLQPAPPGVPALYIYENEGRDLVLALKRNRGRSAVPWLAARLADRVVHDRIRVEAVTWAPTTPARRRGRGYDQAELLARAVARRLQVPSRSLLGRTTSSPQQGRARSERLAGPAFALRAAVPPTVLVVDDVVTTGATLRAAQLCLHAGGAVVVRVLAVAAAAPGSTTW